MTGDITINPTATCLIMTTEILRSMLYRGSELMREVAWAIYDEIHYMRDKERGVIWEECIVLAPSAARFVFLSATVPNGSEFAAWVAATHSAPCHVVSTSHRPTASRWTLARRRSAHKPGKPVGSEYEPIGEESVLLLN